MMFRFLFRRHAALLVGIVSLAGAANAQESQAPIKPEPTKVEQHGMWVFECATYGGPDSEYCTMQQVLTVNETDEVALAVTLAYNPNSGEPVMFAMTPLGVDLAVGMGIKVDDGPQLGVPYTICQEIGCRAAAPLTKPLLASMKAGNTMQVSYSYRGNRLDVPVSLNGFTAAHSALEASSPKKPAQQSGAQPGPAGAPAATAPTGTSPSLTSPPAGQPQFRLDP